MAMKLGVRPLFSRLLAFGFPRQFATATPVVEEFKLPIFTEKIKPPPVRSKYISRRVDEIKHFGGLARVGLNHNLRLLPPARAKLLTRLVEASSRNPCPSVQSRTTEIARQQALYFADPTRNFKNHTEQDLSSTLTSLAQLHPESCINTTEDAVALKDTIKKAMFLIGQRYEKFSIEQKCSFVWVAGKLEMTGEKTTRVLTRVLNEISSGSLSSLPISSLLHIYLGLSFRAVTRATLSKREEFMFGDTIQELESKVLASVTDLLTQHNSNDLKNLPQDLVVDATLLAARREAAGLSTDANQVALLEILDRLVNAVYLCHDEHQWRRVWVQKLSELATQGKVHGAWLDQLVKRSDDHREEVIKARLQHQEALKKKKRAAARA